MKQKKSVEDYLKTIYILSKNKDVHGADIARAIGVSRPTVCVSLKALEEEGYILMDDAREVHLTEKKACGLRKKPMNGTICSASF